MILRSEAISRHAVDLLKARYPQLTVPDNLLRIMYGCRAVDASDVIEVFARSSDPVQAAAIANSVTEAFLDDDVRQRQSLIDANISFLDGQLQDVHARIKVALGQLDSYEQRSGLVMASSMETELETTANSLQDQARDTELQAQNLEFMAGQLAARLGIPAALAGRALRLQNDPVLVGLHGDLVNTESQIAQDSFTRQAPQRVELEAIIRRLRWQIQRRVDSVLGRRLPGVDYTTLQSPMLATEVQDTLDAHAAGLKASDLLGQVNSIRGTENRLPQQEQAAESLQHRLDVLQKTYQMLLGKRVDAGIAQSLTGSAYRVLKFALPPSVPQAPQKKRDLEMAGFAGLLGGILVAWLFEAIGMGSVSTEGIAPALERFGHVLPIHLQSGKAPKRILAEGASSEMAEQFRFLRSGLLAIASHRGEQQVTVLSPRRIPEQGLIMLNVAESLANARHKVLLVDADLHSQSLSVELGHQQDPGLASLLIEGGDWHPFIKTTDNPNLHFLPHGRLTQWEFDAIDPAEISALLATWSAEYSWVLVNVPPVLSSSVGLVVGALVPLRFVLADRDLTTVRDLTMLERLLELVDAPLAGTIGLRVIGRLDLEAMLKRFLQRYLETRSRRWSPNVEN